MLSDFEIRPVDTHKQWKDFYQVKCDLYRNDPSAVIPLRSMEYSLLDDSKHPFYQHAQRQAFVAYRGGRPIARIVAIKDDLHNEHYSDRVGFFGFFECPNDKTIAKALLETAKNWLLDRGLNTMRGPVNPSMKGEFGVLVEGHEYPPFVMMGHTPKYYAPLLESTGLAVVKRFFAFLLDNDHASLEEGKRRLEKLNKFADRVKKRFPTVRVERATKENVDSLIMQINVLGNEVRSEGWGFVPMTQPELDFMVSQVRRIIDPQTVIVAYVDDEIAGYNVTVPDVNWAIRRSKGPDWLRFPQLAFWLSRIPRIRVIALGAARKYRHTGIGMLVAKAMLENQTRFKQWEFSWIIEDNQLSMAALNRSVPTKRYKVYHLYEMPIS